MIPHLLRMAECGVLLVVRSSLCAVVVCPGFFLFSGALQAQTSDATRQIESIQRQIQERVQRDAEEARREAPFRPGMDTNRFLPMPHVEEEARSCRNVHAILISGAPRLSQNVRERIDREYTKHCIGVSEIEQILGIITKDYIDRGYVTTRAHLPAQDLTTGILEIGVVEGFIEEIQLNDNGANSIQPRTAFPAHAGDVLNLRDLEQGIDQINRLSSNAAEIDIRPGSSPGGSVVIVNNEPKFPLHATISYDNHGAAQTGKDQVAMMLNADNLLRINESISFTHRQSMPNQPDRKSSELNSWSLLVPYGYTTFSATGSWSKYALVINTPFGFSLKSNGTTESQTYKLDHIVSRTRDSRISLSGALTFKDAKNYLEDQYLAVSSRRLTVLDVGASLSTFFLGGTLIADAGLNQGLHMGGALSDQVDALSSAPRAQFSKWRYSVSYSRPFRVFKIRGGFSTQLSGQSSTDVLYGSEQFGIGGIYSVRGFVNNTLTGDKGMMLRNEASIFTSLNVGPSIPLRWYVAMDVGKVRNNVENTRDGRLVGMALGVSASWKGVNFDVFHARPISVPSFFQREYSQTWFRLSLSV